MKYGALQVFCISVLAGELASCIGGNDGASSSANGGLRAVLCGAGMLCGGGVRRSFEAFGQG